LATVAVIDAVGDRVRGRLLAYDGSRGSPA